MSASDIKTRHDRKIAQMAKDGRICREIATECGVSYNTVYHRLARAGLLHVVKATVQARREALKPSRRSKRRGSPSYCGSSAIAAIPISQPDHSASELIRTLRADHAALAAYDPSHMVACFHAAGLTLEDIEAGLGIPPVEAVAAIRRAHQGHHP